jgi:hypothetical protein
MAPASRECSNCHATNSSSSSVCTSCQTPFPLSDPTLLGDSTPDANARFLGNEDPGDPNGVSAPQGWSQPVPPPSATGVRGGRLSKGMRLGRRYEIVQMLGEGGMGAVYRAWDREPDRLLALKVIRPELAVHEEILQRFKQELILARKIAQKNVIRIFDLGEADGVKFVTMEFIEGKDLTSIIREKGRLSFDMCSRFHASVFGWKISERPSLGQNPKIWKSNSKSARLRSLTISSGGRSQIRRMKPAAQE